ncbi:MAG: TylF/MycF/NovP-related O-methyltransferase [Fluviicola sp.]
MTFKKRLPGLVKGAFFGLRLHVLFHPFAHLYIWIGNISRLSKWIRQQDNLLINDCYTSKFEYTKRFELYEVVIKDQQLDEAIDYLEFGVSKGTSMQWWINRNKHPETVFYGFDTFTGLPEDWGPFKKGDMSANNAIPDFNDPRCQFYQGLFQQTLGKFLAEGKLSNRKKVIHLDADLYTSTLFVLATLYPYLNKGDILFFDEFNCPTHEYLAFDEFCRSFYVEYKTLGAVNNFYQVAVMIK